MELTLDTGSLRSLDTDSLLPLCPDGSCVSVQMPGEIDLRNVTGIWDNLLRLLHFGARILIIDMSATTSCDMAGARMVVRAHERARAHKADLRLVTTDAGLKYVLGMTGADLHIGIYPDLAAAYAATATGDTPARGRETASVPAR
jgi:anti-anti-sigma factor